MLPSPAHFRRAFREIERHCLWLLPLIPALAEQHKFEMADVHASTTLRAYVQSFGGVVHEGRYFNREATMLALIKAYPASP